METTSLSDVVGSGRGFVALAKTPGSSPSSGYWSTNDDDLSNDFISASLGFYPSAVGYGSCWLSSPYRDLDTSLDADDVGLTLCDNDEPRPEDGFRGPDVRFPPETDMDLEPPEVGLDEPEVTSFKPEMASFKPETSILEQEMTSFEQEMTIQPEMTTFQPEAMTNLELDLVRPKSETRLRQETPQATGSSLFADFLFCDWLHGSRPTDRIFDDFISGDVFPAPQDDSISGGAFPGDVFDGSGPAALRDPDDGWRSTGSVKELERRSLADDEEDEHRIFSTDDLIFNLNPVDPFDSFTPNSRPISPLSPLSLIHHVSFLCYETPPPEVDRNSTSGCSSPQDVDSEFRTSCLDSTELFDVLLCEVLRQSPEADAGPEAAIPELVLVATPSASSTKRKSCDDDDDVDDAGNGQRPRKVARLSLDGKGMREDPRRIELPVTLVTASSNILQITSSSCDRSPCDGPRNVGESPAVGKTQTSGLSSAQTTEQPRNSSSHHACAKTTTASDACANGNDACAVRTAEVLAAMLQAEAVLREPNRGSDIIFAELKSGKVSRSPSTVDQSSPSLSQARGASSLRSFLIRKQRDSSGQNLLHRLLKGETNEAEVRREQAASTQTTR